jgi:hypothetical protein
MFTDLYLETTNPQLSFTDLLSPKILLKIVGSVLFHTVIYASFFHLASYIFLGKWLSSAVNTRMVTALLLIMFFGFFGRFFHVKEVYHAYNNNMEKTRNHLDRLYIGWIFIS